MFISQYPQLFNSVNNKNIELFDAEEIKKVKETEPHKQAETFYQEILDSKTITDDDKSRLADNFYGEIPLGNDGEKHKNIDVWVDKAQEKFKKYQEGLLEVEITDLMEIAEQLIQKEKKLDDTIAQPNTSKPKNSKNSLIDQIFSQFHQAFHATINKSYYYLPMKYKIEKMNQVYKIVKNGNVPTKMKSEIVSTFHELVVMISIHTKWVDYETAKLLIKS